MTEIKLGFTYRDNRTGFQGIATDVHYTLDATGSVKLQPPSADNTKLPDAHWFSTERVAEVPGNNEP